MSDRLSSAPAWRTWNDLVRFRAANQPHRVALRFLADGEAETDALTFAELSERATAIAGWLQQHLAPGDRVLLTFPPSLDFACAFLGCLFAGAIAVPTYSPRRRRRDGRLAAIVGSALPRLALTNSQTLSALEETLANQPELQGLEWVAVDGLPESFREKWCEPEVRPDTLAMLQYTSGSTALPKGVMVSHHNLLTNSRDLDLGWDHTDESVIVSWLPLFHDLGLIYGMLQPIYRGITGVLMPPVTFLQRPIRWLQAISRYRGTHSAAPNFAYDLCVEKVSREQAETLDLSCWAMTLNAAEPIRAASLERFAKHFAISGFRARTLTPGYGLAECTLKVVADRASEDYQLCRLDADELATGKVVEASAGTANVQTLVACGRSEIDTRVRIVDPDTRIACPPDRVGEVWVSGESVAQGYWQQPEQTRETFQARLADTGEGPFLRTGDLGFLHRDRLYITGRIKDLIIIRGLNLYPQDIEQTVSESHPALQPNAAAAFPLDTQGEEALAVVQEVRRSEVRRLDTEAVITAIRRRVLEEHDQSLHAIVLVKPGRVPKTSSGKIQRRLCRSLFLEQSLEPIHCWTTPTAPMTREETDPATPRRCASSAANSASSIRRRVTQWIAARTRLDPQTIDPSRPFADYGLNSLLAAELAAQLETWLGRPIEPTVFWRYSTIASLAEQLADGAADGSGDRQFDTQRLTSIESRPPTTGAPIAIVGMACRFPGGADNPQAYWRLLRDGSDAITEIPPDRWDADRFFDSSPATPGKYYTKAGGFVHDVDGFDPGFFRITPREAADLDPQQRLAIEVVWTALEDAGIPPSRLRGTDAGVFVGSSTDDYALRSQRRPLDQIDAYSSLGVSRSIAAGRIAYVLGTRGPAIQLDTACSSSLVAVYQACQSLRAGDCNLAMVAGVNLMLAPETTIGLCQMRALAPDGRCKPFDASANGYVRGEGCGAVILKRLEDARADGDRILAVIRAAAINHDGTSNGLTAPNGDAQRQLLERCLERSGITAADVGYLEAHGTGTPLGDPVEMEAIEAVYGQNRPPGHPLYLGSVKANLGHLEAAAGMAGLIKVVLMLQHGQIPPQPNFEHPNPHLNWSASCLKVPTAGVTWQGGPTRYAGVSAFGFSGTNVHLIASSFDDSPVQAPGKAETLPLPLSARSREALIELAERHARDLADGGIACPRDVAFTAAVGRDHHEHRLCLVGASAKEYREALEHFATAPDHGRLIYGVHTSSDPPPKLAFLFTGQGCLYKTMATELYATQPVFRETIKRCQQALRSDPELSQWIDVDTILDPSPQRLQQTEFVQPALFAIQVALAELWRSWGVIPNAVLGHSIGEIAAFCVAGVFPVEAGMRIAAKRGRLMQALPAGGGMLAVLANEKRVAEAIAPFEGRVWIAAINGPQDSVVSGDLRALRRISEQLTAEGIRTVALPVSHAFHSPRIEPIAEAFREAISDMPFAQPRIPIVSCVSGDWLEGQIASVDYWLDHLRRPVQFARGITALYQAGYRDFLEVGPKPTLLPMARRCLPRQEAEGCQWLPSLRPGASDPQVAFETLARLYTRGVAIDWQGVFQPIPGRRVAISTYPFQHQRFWLGFEDGTGETTPATTASLHWLPSPAKVASEVVDRLSGMEDHNLKMRPILDEIALQFMMRTVCELANVHAPGDRFEPEACHQRIPASHRPKLQRMISHLINRGLLRSAGEECWIERPADRQTPLEMLAKLEGQQTTAEVSLLKRAGSRLTEILRGETDALSLLFPEGSTEQAAKFYADSPLFQPYNKLAGAVLQRLVQRLPGGSDFRLLEVGAGTGGLTTHVLPHLPPEHCEYVFTDVSSVFLNAADRCFADCGILKTALFDVSQPPEKSGLSRGSFDVVLAANVLHATPYLRETLGHVHQLLKPGGWLILLEGTNPPLWGDMVFALIDGWWIFQDKDLRPDYPLMPRRRWLDVLEQTGFPRCVGLTDQKYAAEAIHTLFLAQAGVAPTQQIKETRFRNDEDQVERESWGAPEPSGREVRTDAAPVHHPVAEEITALICDHAARIMRLPAAQLDLHSSLVHQGMDSLMITELRAVVERESGVELPMRLLTGEPTIASLAAYLREQIPIDRIGRPGRTALPRDDVPHELVANYTRRPKPECASATQTLVRLQAEGSLPPLFFVPAGDGDLLAFHDIAGRLGNDRPVYGLQPPGARQLKQTQGITLFQLVSRYLAEITRVQPEGPYHLAGYSAGGIIAVELARELQRRGRRIAMLIAMDPPVRVPVWLDLLYRSGNAVGDWLRLTPLVERSGVRWLRRMFHAMLDEGLKTHTALVRGHHLEHYPGQIIYFRACGSWVSLLSLRPRGRFWNRLATGGVEPHWVPGTHYGMLRGTNAAVLAEELRLCLERCAEQQPESP